MNLGIYLTRRTHLKFLSPVIDAALARRHSVLLVADVKAAKRGDTLDVNELAALWPEARIESSVPHWLDCLIAPDPVMPGISLPRVSVTHWYDDNWLRPPRTDVIQCYTSEYHRQQHGALWGTEAKGPVVGWLPSDQARRWVPPQERDCAVLFSLKLGVEPWRDSSEGRAFYKTVVRAVKAQAEFEGLRFVVKSRAKNRDPLWLRWLADEFVGEKSMVPATSLSLLARAKWAVHFESGAGLEAVLMGAFSIAVRVPQPHIIDLPGGRLQYGGVPMHDWPGAARYELYSRDSLTVPHSEPEARQAYMERFLGPCDGRVATRVLEIAEAS